MGRFGVDEVDNYGGNGGSSFFSLKNDGDVARVRFMYGNINDVAGIAVHEVTVDEKSRYVSCLRAYNEPKSKCPLCEANNFQRAKLYIPIYDIEADEVKLWERGKNFFAKLSALCSRYANSTTPLVAHIFEIERHGKKGDTQTTYDIFEIESDKTTLDDLPEIPEVIGTIVLEKTAGDMLYYVDNQCFPNTDGAPTRSERSTEKPTGSAAPTGRRTPSRRGETF